MGIKSSHTNVTGTVYKETKRALEIKAAMQGLSLSQYVAGLLKEASLDVPTEAESTIHVRSTRDQHGSLAVTIPPEIGDHMRLEPGRPIAFAAVPGGALIRAIK